MPHTLARRLALAGFMAFAPGALFPLGGYPGDEESARVLFQKLDQANTSEDMVAAAGRIKAELLVVLASDDERTNVGWPAYEEALKAAGVTYRMLQPAATLHGFNNDTTPRCSWAAAAEAWGEALALFNRTLRG